MKHFEVSIKTAIGIKSTTIIAEDENHARVLASDKLETGSPFVTVTEVNRRMFEAIRAFGRY